MHSLSLLAYLLSVAALFAKYIIITLVQAKGRYATRTFRWPEDAATWSGAAPAKEDETVERAQAALRNDSESQTFYFVFGAAWLALGAPGSTVAFAAGVYTVARVAHTFFLIRPSQPLRNRVFAIGHLVLLGIVADVLRRAFASL